MAEQVDPTTARKGTFLKSFPIKDYRQMLDYCKDTEKAMKRHQEIVGKRIVFTRIGKGAGMRKFDTWQVYLINS